jgi:hypothetical protein
MLHDGQGWLLITACGHLTADFKLADDGVKLMTKSDRSGERVNTGIAFVRFRDAEEAAVAAAAQHRKMMGNRYIECIPYTAPTVRTKS